MLNLPRIGFQPAMMGLIFVVSSCANQPTEPPSQDRIIINNNSESLNQRIKYFDDVVIQLDVSKYNTAARLSGTSKLHLKLLAEVYPPVIDGEPLHASHVTLDDAHAYVSYSTVRNRFLGGVEIIDILDKRHPVIKSQALFLDTDITIAIPAENRLLLGEATDSDNNANFDSPACLEIIELQQGQLTSNTLRYDLPSFNANDIASFDNAIYVTSGTSNGAVSIFDKQTFALVNQISLEGAKAIAKSDGYVVVLEGTGTALHLFDRETFAFSKTIDLGCSNFFAAKAEIDIVDNIAYVSAWDCGTIVVDLTTEAITTTLPAPEGGHTNSVSVSGGRIFIANGSAGLLVAEISDLQLDIVGEAKFDGSANFVVAKDNLLFVANGVGGLKILEIIDPVKDIYITKESSVRADRGADYLVYKNAASVDIKMAGRYRVYSEVWYNSGDAQKNESFYLEIRDKKDTVANPQDPNAGHHKVVQDHPGEPHVILRESGVFALSQGVHSIDLYHYAVIADDYPQFLHGPFTGPESVHLRGFKLKFVAE